MNFRNKEKVMRKLRKPSRNKRMNALERVGLVSGGTLLTLAGIRSQKKKKRSNVWPFLVAGGALAVIGLVGRRLFIRMRAKGKTHLKVKSIIVIDRPRTAVYDFWRQLEKLPHFMQHIREVKEISNSISHWKANIQNIDISWDAEIVEDQPGRVIAWRSLPGSEIKTDGRVAFKDVGKNQTELSLTLKYADDTGRIAKGFALLYHPIFKKQVKNELERCKQLLEAREERQAAPSRQETPIGHHSPE